MFRRTFLVDRLLRSLRGTEPFRQYCRDRGILCGADDGSTADARGLRDWDEALASLPPERRAAIELELMQVNELACRQGVYRLIDACAGRGLPSDLIPGEAAQALWFLLHSPDVFAEVFFRAEILEAESWHHATTVPGIDLGDLAARRAAFERELARFYRAREGTGRFCASQSYRVAETGCTIFLGHVSGRPRLIEAFTEAGEHRPQRLRPASPVGLAYYAPDGTVLLRSRLRAEGKVRDLMRALGLAVLGVAIDEASFGVRFDLDRLARRFEPPLPEGISQVRVKALELCYPASAGRRRVRLETGAADGQFAILELLAAHLPAGVEAGRLRVTQADLQVRQEVRGRSRSWTVRLWPDRTSLNQTPAAERLRACLRLWEIEHAR